LGGPLLGVISLGMFVPFANEYGALVGLVVSVAVNMWISIGSFTRGNPPKSKPLRFDGCPGFNTSNFTETKTMKDYLSKLNIVSELKPNTFE
jgi:Na+/proline symporter